MTPPLNPFCLLDENLSGAVAAEVAIAIRFPITTIAAEWPQRDSQADPLLDEEIIRHLGRKAGLLALWITADWQAHRKHRDLIVSQGISVLWLRAPGGSPTLAEQRRMLTAVLPIVRRLLLAGSNPTYFRVRLESGPGLPPFLERLPGTLLDRPLNWQRVP